MGIRQTLVPMGISQQEESLCFQTSRERTGHRYMFTNGKGQFLFR